MYFRSLIRKLGKENQFLNRFGIFKRLLCLYAYRATQWLSHAFTHAQIQSRAQAGDVGGFDVYEVQITWRPGVYHTRKQSHGPQSPWLLSFPAFADQLQVRYFFNLLVKSIKCNTILSFSMHSLTDIQARSDHLASGSSALLQKALGGALPPRTWPPSPLSLAHSAAAPGSFQMLCTHSCSGPVHCCSPRQPQALLLCLLHRVAWLSCINSIPRHPPSSFPWFLFWSRASYSTLWNPSAHCI